MSSRIVIGIFVGPLRRGRPSFLVAMSDIPSQMGSLGPAKFMFP